MKKVLIIYADSSFLRRRTVSAYLNSFDRYLEDCYVYYHNAILNKLPFIPFFRSVDIVIYHHSVTTVWDRKSYIRKLEKFAKMNDSSSKRIALMQDEYKNIDLVRKMVDVLHIDLICSVAPESEWEKIYGKEIVNSGRLKAVLTGYLEEDANKFTLNHKRQVREIDVGYRGDWSKLHIKLGKLGNLKNTFPSNVLNSQESKYLKLDIKLGKKWFLNGRAWPKFLSDCRYVLGVPSGSSVLDRDGTIESEIKSRITKDKNVSVKALYDDIVKSEDGSLDLAVLSPRHFEAIANGCCQILIRSNYNGILKPWVHYIPVESDFKDLDGALKVVNDESLRLKILDNCYKDILSNKSYYYSSYVNEVINSVKVIQNTSRYSGIYKVINILREETVRFLTLIKRLNS